MHLLIGEEGVSFMTIDMDVLYTPWMCLIVIIQRVRLLSPLPYLLVMAISDANPKRYERFW